MKVGFAHSLVEGQREVPFLTLEGAQEVEALEMAADYARFKPLEAEIDAYLKEREQDNAEGVKQFDEFMGTHTEPYKYPAASVYLHTLSSLAMAESINHTHEPERQRLVILEEHALFAISALGLAATADKSELANFWKGGDYLAGIAQAMMQDVIVGFEVAGDFVEPARISDLDLAPTLL